MSTYALSGYGTMRKRMSRCWKKLPIKTRVRLRAQFLLRIVQKGWHS